VPLERQHVQTLLSQVSRTCDEELDCGDCLAAIAEFVELELVGAEVPEALQRIRHHLEMCPECAEEYEVLYAVFSSLAIDAPL